MTSGAELALRSATDLAAGIAARDFSARELLDACLEQYERLNPVLNAVVVERIDTARERADQADQATALGESWGPLHGLPATVKEVLHWQGTPSTWGDPALVNNVPDHNAATVDLLLNAGAILWGKTNVPLRLMEWQTHNAIHGRTNNPWDLERTPGGSSGGSAAAVAAGMSAIEIGSDIGGSIRFPASYCGIAGHRPTWGIIPQGGHELPGWEGPLDINTVGPLARTAGDIEMLLESVLVPHHRLQAPGFTELSEVRVAVLMDNPNGELDESLTAVLEDAFGRLTDAGVQVERGALPDVDLARSFDLYRGLEQGGDYASSGQDGGMTYWQWLQLNNERERHLRKWNQFFADVDFLVCPVSSTAATLHETDAAFRDQQILINGELHPAINQWFWAGFSASVGLPSASFPVGHTSEGGLPVGLQVVGPRFGDLAVARFGRLIETVFGSFQPAPLAL